MRCRLLLACVVSGICAGCGTTRWSDTQRTATEQLLLSNAMDRAVDRLDFRALGGRTTYLDATALRATTDAGYLASSLRQQMLAQGCIVKDKREEADYVVEVRAGAIGTDRREVLFGIPATSVPQTMPVATVPAAIPELPLAKKTEQRAVAKIALFAYNRETGRPVWQSGTLPIESKTKDLWVLGAGPFQRGSIVTDSKLADAKPVAPLLRPGDRNGDKGRTLQVTDEAYFVELKGALSRQTKPAAEKKEEVAHASGEPGLLKADIAQAKPLPPAQGPQVAKADAPAAKPPEAAGPLDAVVPASHNEPVAGVSSRPNSGMDGFWMLPPPAPMAAPVAPAPPATTSPAVASPFGGWLHGTIGKGLGIRD